MKTLVLNGPNLNMLGSRQPDTYGTATLEEVMADLAGWASPRGVEIDPMQSNHEGELVEAIQTGGHDGIVLNPGALSHTSRALTDAILSVETPVVEVHISNIKERESWRAVTTVSEACVRTIYGRGTVGYRHALLHLLNRPHLGDAVRYGPAPDNIGDLSHGEGPLAVLVHGGFWRHEWERDTMESLTTDLSGRGFSTWNLEYRRIGTGGGWPGSAHDLLTALDDVPRLGLGHTEVLVVTHSAGFPTAVWAAARSTTKVAGMVALAPVTDLATHAASAGEGSAEAQRLLDSGAPATIEPTTYPVLVVHGQDDTLVPTDHSLALAERDDVQLAAVSGGHFELLDPERDHWSGAVDFLTELSHLSTAE